MYKTHQIAGKFILLGTLVALPLLPAVSSSLAEAQTTTADPSVPHRIHLILKDGSYQIVTSYTVRSKDVLYTSAERGGAQEIIPLALVDLDATHAWEQQHIAGSHPEAKPTIDPELLKEEADRAAFTPEIAPDLSLPEQDSVLALDTFQGNPELIPLAQSAGELNRNTAHNVLKSAINPRSASHQIVELKGLSLSSPAPHRRPRPLHPHRRRPAPRRRRHLHGRHAAVPSGNAPTASAGGSPSSRYVIVRADVRTDSRILASFSLSLLGTPHRQEDVVETTAEPLRGGHWLKLTPKQPLIFGEYALLEVISDREINLGVWDFGIHPVAPENRDAIKPQPKRPFRLDHRRPD